ncbi:MAG TPA: KTSC domain-containing protein [Paracoccaceae bacterium]|nr:KTSC domain-containing protein [Paracoccaceae bacterium]
MIPVDVAGSSCVAHAEYCPESRVLRIGYVGSGTYDYEGVPPRIVEEFRAADSKGHFVNTAIKPHFRYRRREDGAR